jgi:hypothetical protein
MVHSIGIRDIQSIGGTVGDLDHLRHRQERSRSPSSALHGDQAVTRQELRQDSSPQNADRPVSRHTGTADGRRSSAVGAA